MNRTARRIRTLSAATLALTAAGLTVGSLSAMAFTPPFPIPTIPLFPFPTIPVSPTIPPVLTIPGVTLPPGVTIPPIITIPPVIFSMPVSLSAAPGPVERGANYSYSMTISMGSGITGPVNLIHSIPAALSGAVWSCSAAGGATCGGSAAGSGNISRVLGMPGASSVTFLVNGTISADATNFQLNMSAVRAGTPTNRSADVLVNVPVVTTLPPPSSPTTSPAPTTIVPVLPVVPPSPAPAPTPNTTPSTTPNGTPAQQPIVIVLQQTTTPPLAKKAVVKKAVVKKAKKAGKKKVARKPARRVVSTKKIVH